jgi:hypothetical protein
VRPELEAPVKRAGKSLPISFQASQTSDDEIGHPSSEGDLTSGNEVMTAVESLAEISISAVAVPQGCHFDPVI